MSHNETLTPIQQRAIIALMESRNIKVAAQRVRVGRSTLQRWLKEPAFQKALSESESEVIGNASRSLLAGMEIAITELYRIMTNPNPDSENTKRKACNDWLGFLLKFREYSNYEERISNLERVLNNKQ